MAKATKRCDWCNMRRKTDNVSVVMSETLGGHAVQKLWTWTQDWYLCSQCVRACKAALGNLRTLSIGRTD